MHNNVGEKVNIINYLQKLGRALMVSLAPLPAATILMGIGYWINPIGLSDGNVLATFLIKSGSAIIEHISVLFAVGIAYGLSKDKDGASALAGFISFLVLTNLCSPAVVSVIQKIPLNEVPAAFGKIENQFIGILVGAISAEIYNRFSNVELPKALSFFSGCRLVPIITSFFMILVGFILMFIWPIIFNALAVFGEQIEKLGAVGAGIYAFFNRLLIPIGLHHLLNSVFLFDVASINDIPNFLGGQQAINAGKAIVGVTGQYQAGFFPIMMFGMPGAAWAIYQSAYPQNKPKVMGIMMAAAFASFFTGITEPLEFSFIFVAPILYFFHALLTGISVFIAAYMHWIAGFGFSAGLVDMALWVRNPLAINWYMLIPQGLAFFVIYYVVFRFIINKFNLKTLGRELTAVDGKEIDAYCTNAGIDNNKNDITTLARHYIDAIGGYNNVISIDGCMTRLRINVKDASCVNDLLVKSLGAISVIRLNKSSVQVIIGPRADLIAYAINDVLNHGIVADTRSQYLPVTVLETLLAPVTGEVVALDQVPDEAFASKVVGDGLAILPTDKIVVAPAGGTIIKIFDTNHAFCLETNKGVEIIVHIGIDTVSLNGQGFKRLIEEGTKVKSGQSILELDLEFLNANARSMISPVVVSNSDDYAGLTALATGCVVSGHTKLFDIQK
ncbi:used N-acetyl glucosamine specific PTS enzymes: IIC component, IIB component, IIA component [Serratia symbiotica str. 'Cinara cedri']|nr:used N-acetyl glucosamine specific PTS enzymes: IIC component, IIB component, IIA component [Serratia symbiotica str. 'Cinara cedri']